MKHLAAIALAALATAAQAAPFAITLTGPIVGSTFAEIRNGERYAATLVYDNGNNTALNQTWQTADLRCVIWRVNNDASVVYTQTGLNGVVPQINPRTDATGALTARPFISTGGNNAYTVSGLMLTGTPAWTADEVNIKFDDADGVRRFHSGVVRGTWSAPVPVASPCATPVLPPGVPTQVVAVPDNGQVSLYWTAPVGGTASSAAARYTVVAKTGTLERGTCTVTPPTTGCTLIGLTNDTPHQFYITAIDATGAQSPAATVYGTPSATPAPSTVTQVTATPGDGAVTVAWQTLPAGGTTPVSYTATAIPGNAACTVAAPALSCTVQGLTNGTRYSFRVTARGANGSTSAESLPWAYAVPRAIPGTPAVPMGLTAQAGNAQVALAWDAPAAGTPVPTSYTVSAQPGGRSCTATYPARTCTVTGLSNGTAYSFVVSATQAGAGGGTSGPSAEVSATPQGAGPGPNPGGPQPVPTLGEWGLMLLAGLLGVTALGVRRRNS